MSKVNVEVITPFFFKTETIYTWYNLDTENTENTWYSKNPFWYFLDTKKNEENILYYLRN